jgi:7-cyano-7-deazaguanine synthase in queuosine biosynthesis
MSWNVIIRVGADDHYVPKLPAGEPRIFAVIDCPGDPSTVRNNILDEILGKIAIPPPLEALDLLNLAIAVYTADLKISRNLAEDAWMRDFVFYMPVVNLERWTEVMPRVVQMLEFLTGDRWQINFRQRQPSEKWEVKGEKIPRVEAVSLFSGGLDSLIGAIDLLGDGKSVGLVGHHGAGITNSVQKRVISEIQRRYRDRITPYMFYVQPPKKGSGRGEPSMRSRSVLFLVLGTVVANALGCKIPLIIAENGLISLNVPLTNSRLGSLSTRTTHPHFISLYQEMLLSLGLVTPVEMPYRFHTKGEMLANAKNQKVLQSTVNLTMSCSHPEIGRYHQGTPGNHCGYCVPCIIRRAALASVQLDNCKYNVDILKDPPMSDRDTGRDFRAFQMAIERSNYANPRSALFDVLSAGPLPPDDVKYYVGVYSRGMDEVRSFFSSSALK